MKVNLANQTPKTLAKILSDHLEKDVLNFWLKHGIDDVDGGYLTGLDRRGEVYNTEKWSYTQTRMIYAFSEGYRLFKNEAYKKAAQQGFEFYTQSFWDTEYAGWFGTLNRAGQPIMPEKRTYNFAFVIYCFSEYYQAIGDERVLEHIDKTMELLDTKLADNVNNGWFEQLSRDWSVVLNPGKTFNSPMHLLEAMFSGYEHIDRERFLKRIKAILDLMENTCLYQPQGLYLEQFQPDWIPKLKDGKPIINYGHLMETAFFFLKLVDIVNQSELRDRAFHFIDFSMKNGWDEKVGMACFGTPDGEHDLIYCYWCQSETLAALARAYRVTQQDKYWDWLVKHVNVIFTQFADPEYGEWYIRRDPDGRIAENSKGANHKACYHLTQALSCAVADLEAIS